MGPIYTIKVPMSKVALKRIFKARERVEQQLALARVAGQRGGALELGTGLVAAAQLREQIAAHARQPVVRSSAGSSQRVDDRQPGPGPNAMPTATARLSSTTGDGATWASASYSAAMRPSRCPRRAGARMAGGDGGLQRVRAGAPPSASARPALPGRGGSAAGPSGPVLVQQQHRLARRGRCARAPRDAWISISATRPCTSASSGTSSARIAAEAQRVLAQRRPHPVVARGRGVALVEDQVNDFQHRRQPRRQLVAARHLERHLRLGERALGADDALRDRRLGDQERSRDLVGRQAAEQSQRQRDARVGRTAPGGRR